MTNNPAAQIETKPATPRPLIVKRGEGETIESLGSKLTFLHREPGSWSMMQVSAPRGVGAPPHAHDFSETYYLLSGSLRLTVGGQETVLGAGDSVHIPGGTVHGFEGNADGPTDILILQSPGDADEFLRACAREIALPADRPRVAELAARHGIRIARKGCVS